MTQPTTQAFDTLSISELDHFLGRLLVSKGDPADSGATPSGTLSKFEQYVDSHGAGQVFTQAINHKALNLLARLMTSSQKHSYTLSQLDGMLGKPAGYSCRSLFSVLGSVESIDRPDLLRAFSKAIATHLEEGAANPILKNGFTQFSQGLVAGGENSFQVKLFSELHEWLPAQNGQPGLLDLHRALLDCIMAEDFDESRSTYDLILNLTKKTPGAEQSIHQAIAGLLGTINLSPETSYHLIDFMLSRDEAFASLQAGSIKAFNSEKDRSDLIMEAVRLGLRQFDARDEGVAYRFNAVDATVLAKGIKTRDDFDVICRVASFDKERIDKNALSYEARSGLFTMELGV